MPTSAMPHFSHHANMGSPGPRPAGGLTRAEAAVVETVSMDVTVFAPGVAEAGENEQEARLGRPEHASVMELVKAPFCG